MKSYFFTTSNVIHSSLIHINAPGERGGERRRERKGGGERMKYKGEKNLPCHKSQWPAAYIDPLPDLYKDLGDIFHLSRQGL